MTKFKEGQKVLFNSGSTSFETVILKADKDYAGEDTYTIRWKWEDGHSSGECSSNHWWHNENLQPIKEDNMRKKVRLTKGTLGCKKGAVFEEICDDGTQDFECITPELIKYTDSYKVTRAEVENNPKVFEEVFSASDVYFTKEEFKQVKKLAKK